MLTGDWLFSVAMGKTLYGFLIMEVNETYDISFLGGGERSFASKGISVVKICRVTDIEGLSLNNHIFLSLSEQVAMLGSLP